jgi:solute carrier family 25 aspartate/glutamate transporter 12/13
MFSPLEANLVWHFASRGRGGKTRLILEDFRALLDEKVRRPLHVLLPSRQPSTWYHLAD